MIPPNAKEDTKAFNPPKESPNKARSFEFSNTKFRIVIYKIHKIMVESITRRKV
jgi:hypothetical protein